MNAWNWMEGSKTAALRRWLWLLLALGALPAPWPSATLHAQEAKPHRLIAVPIQQVSVDDGFWAPKFKTWREVTIPDCFAKFEKDGAIANFDLIRDGLKGEHGGPPWYDGLIYEMIRGCADFLAARPDPVLEAKLDGYIEHIAAAAAKDPDGYLNTYTQLKEPDHRWGLNGGNDNWQHDVYNAGALVEAAVHYYRATSKTNLLGVATRLANHMCDLMGPPPKKNVVPGHSLAEEAFVKLYLLFREKPALKAQVPVPVDEARYLKLAEFWIDNRGNHEGRRDYGAYGQDHLPVLEQETLEGHAVRATLLCAGLVATAQVNGRADYLRAATRLWDNMVRRRMYIIGGLGAVAGHEGFGPDYDLPNNGYLETCAAIGAGFFHHNLNLALGEAKYADELERVLYNSVLPGVSLAGNTYFYENPLQAGKDRTRWSWHGCPCCPPMFLKIMGALPGYIYATDPVSVYVNLFIGSRAAVTANRAKIVLRQATRYPWDGLVRLAIDPETETEFDLNLRLPAWCAEPSITINGAAPERWDRARGYARIRRTWKAGDLVELKLPMAVERVRANPRVIADAGRVALRRGPLVYCLEGLDNGGAVQNLAIPSGAPITAVYREGFLGGVVALTGPAWSVRRADWPDELYRPEDQLPGVTRQEFLAIPYYANANRAPSDMTVWTVDSIDQVEPLPGPDVVLADFEGTNYVGWTSTGTAFGPGPARGTLPNQMPVEGFKGAGLVNSFHSGDAATGTLTSAEFPLSRKYLAFLIGGGGWTNQTFMELLVDGRAVRTASGPNTQPGGSEALAPSYWDVGQWLNRTARLRIVDRATGGWGHISVDQVVLSDLKPPGVLTNATRRLGLEKRFLNLPIKNGGPKRIMTVAIDGQEPREFEIELADGPADWWAFMDVGAYGGKQAKLTVNRLPEDSTGLSSIDQTDALKGAEPLYRERLRPQFHFTSRRGWNNDPNGLVYYQGEYHLFYQHNPYGWNWGNMHWGHAVSPDLIHWKELPIALYPDRHGTMFSGSAVVDWDNTAGFQTGAERALVCIFTAAGKPFTQGLAFSNDRGRSWTKYANNPVLPHIAAENRDPKVIWYAPDKKWLMALYLDKSDFAIFSSKDLKSWERLCDVTIPGTSECPEFFRIPVDGDPNNTRWVFYGGNGGYLVGRFDGKAFTPESEPLRLHRGNCWYASQTYTDIPPADGRRILVPWGQMSTPGMPFNQMMGLPVALTLHTTARGLRLHANPVAEHSTLRTHSVVLAATALLPSADPLVLGQGELVDLTVEFAPGEATELTFSLRGIPVNYDNVKHELSCQNQKAPLQPRDGKVRLRMLVDRTSIDIFGNDGELYMPMGVIVPANNRTLLLAAKGAPAKLLAGEVHLLKSAWE